MSTDRQSTRQSIPKRHVHYGLRSSPKRIQVEYTRSDSWITTWLQGALPRRQDVHARAIYGSLRPDPIFQRSSRSSRSKSCRRAHPNSRLIQPRRLCSALPSQDYAVSTRTAEEQPRSNNLCDIISLSSGFSWTNPNPSLFQPSTLSVTLRCRLNPQWLLTSTLS